MGSNSISNFVSYNVYYGLFLTYVFPIILLLLICLVIGYLASINRKLKEMFIIENNDNKTLYVGNESVMPEQTNNKTLYDATIVPAIIISVLGIFLILMALIFSFD